MRAICLLFIVAFLGSGILFSNQLTSLEQLNAPDAAQNFAPYLKAIDRNNRPRVLILIRDIYRKELPVFQRLNARRELSRIFNSIQQTQINSMVLEMDILLTVQHLKLLEEEKKLPQGASPCLSVDEARRILDKKDGFDLCD